MDRRFFARPADLVARELIGCSLIFKGVGGVIVETEAYDDQDPASHSARGPTARNRSMFGPPGHAYLYRSYGLHWCFNIVCGVSPGAGVLVRALHPVTGIIAMRQRRGDGPDTKLCAGPGRLCAALGLDGAWDGHDLSQPPFALLAATERQDVLAGPRIGISRAVDVPWRFGLAGSPCLSRPFGRFVKLPPGDLAP
ncbi:3-methyladenine DNA glycosylase [Bosea sp. AAP35]|nr:3-methyladenine DNA glycosylase [Bosea sp. AAP35]